MKCEILSVGTELLMGNITNTNARYLSEKLAELGIDVFYQHVVGDNLERVANTFKTSLERSDIVIATGGLGPTDDDLTKEGLCKALELKLIPHQPSIDKITDFFKSICHPMAECNVKQGYIPEGSKIIENNNGTAPGILLEAEGKIVILLPGPPSEMIPMFENKLFSYLQSKSNASIFSKTLKVVGIGESNIQEKLNGIFDKQTNPTIAPYAKNSEVHLRISAKSENKTDAFAMIKDLEDKVTEILGEHVYGFDADTLEGVVISLLKKNNLTIALAESCTGGLLSQRLTSVPGASCCFLNGLVTYSNDAKCKFLGVSSDTLIEYGAVSSQTALEMAVGVKNVSRTDIGVSITGIAGPDGGTEEKPVGLCFIGIAYKDKASAIRFIFKGNREKIRWFSSTRALDLIRKFILEEKEISED